ncbi:sulfotransferase family 2 domain-containing protein [Sulfitobacter sp. HGT1]|uniref:sulfotransferase family 2 domain-containing protein n=1 Tax=Sulfitobacter sp. HGT1 TaxID=2735435 RepID=UPI001594345F|nr:sulfotransferase family 2 domain-containing protein [Sulfitobacter sp. HGT1]
MIISRGRNYIFVHIPKTGGTSMALALEARAMKDDIMLGDTPKAVKRRKRMKNVPAAGRLWKHSTLADIEGVVTRDEIAQMFCFALVRNPWDRVVSYYHWLRDQSFDHPMVRLAQQTGFADFLVTPALQDSLTNAPYGSYLQDGARVDRANLFIRLEHFAQDAEPLFDHLGFRVELPVENASDRAASYEEYYTDDLAQIVARICSDDISRFGYGFGRAS